MIKEIDVAVGTSAVNQGRSSVDDKPEPILRVDTILKGVSGILTFLTHATPTQTNSLDKGLQSVVYANARTFATLLYRR